VIAGKRVLAVVPARGGSKGVALKNIRPVNGVPLIAMVAPVASQVAEIDRLVVSTDHDEIAAAARAAGLDVPFTRPAELSGDVVADWDVLVHALREMDGRDACSYDVILMLQPTCPLRRPEHLRGVLHHLVSGGYDSVWTVSPTDAKFHPLKQLTLEDGRLGYFDPKGAAVIARQQLSPVYHRNGAAYAITRACLLEQKSILGRQAGAVVVADPLVNIDTLDDFRRLEELLSRRP
jgi:CMP-N,N'-diacetyllegionaminic acid synthase